MTFVPSDIDDHELRTKETMGLVLSKTRLVNGRTLTDTTTGVYVVFIPPEEFGYRDTIYSLERRGIICKKLEVI